MCGVYDPAGKVIGEIDVPERPTGIAFGGPDRRTLFVQTHRTLYAVRTRVAGEPRESQRGISNP